MNRKPVYAGKFYPENKNELDNDLKKYFSLAKNRKNDAFAVISPHAGYMFSGEVAASAINQINPDKKYENVFVITSSHSCHFNGASIYNTGNYETPLGEIKVNKNIADTLIKEYAVFDFIADAHLNEHSLEVQLPFLQYHLKHGFSLIPIVIGGDNKETSKSIADALMPYFNKNNLFIISSDFSHYPNYDDAVEIDNKTAKAVCSNNPQIFLETLQENKKSGINNLATDICGTSAVLCLLYLTENGDFEYNMIDYRNSGDSPYGEKNRVVGYHAISVTGKNDNEFNLSDKEREELLKIARKNLELYIGKSKSIDLSTEVFNEKLQNKCGIFVTLKKDDKLRGCLGRFESSKNIPETVAELVVSSALNDTRFSPVKAKELNDIKIEISVLSPMQKINSIDEIELGKHGIYIKKGNNSGTFLPEVATDTNWELEEFLGHCAQDKADIGWEGWKDAEIFIYQSIKFSE